MNGVGDQYFRASRPAPSSTACRSTPRASTTLAQEVVIDTTTRDTFFTNGEDPLGQVLLVGQLPLRVIGVVKASSSGFGPSANQLNIYAPYTTVMSRVLGQSFLQVDHRARQGRRRRWTRPRRRSPTFCSPATAREDFTLMNTDTIRETIESTTQTLTLFISAIALISLLVGGIGVMNIMLVSVTERTREIGVRLAIGARRGDIMRQFLIEAVLVCIVGGGIGVALSLGISVAGAAASTSGFTVPFSPMTVALAFGLFDPHRRAVRLHAGPLRRTARPGRGAGVRVGPGPGEDVSASSRGATRHGALKAARPVACRPMRMAWPGSLSRTEGPRDAAPDCQFLVSNWPGGKR